MGHGIAQILGHTYQAQPQYSRALVNSLQHNREGVISNSGQEYKSLSRLVFVRSTFGMVFLYMLRKACFEKALVTGAIG